MEKINSQRGPGRPRAIRQRVSLKKSSVETRPGPNGLAAERPSRRRSSTPPQAEPSRRRLPLLLRRAWFSLNQAFRRFSAQAGITPDQFTVLRTLMEHEPLALTQRELADRMTSDPNTITSLVKRMEASGLIRRRADVDDRRAQRLHITAMGNLRFNQAKPLAAELQTRVLRSLPESRREEFLRELEIVANACQEAQRDWP